MKVSVVVPAFNEEKLLGENLRALTLAAEGLVARGWEWELIVCDNNSTDRTAEIAVAAGARVVFEPINQISRARNCGASVATGDWLLFIDADSTASRELFADTAEAMERGHCLAGGVVLRFDTASFLARRIVGFWNGISRAARLFAGSYIFVERKAFEAVGGFSRELFVAEELELCQRLKRWGKGSGKRVIILTEHPLQTSARKLKLYSPWQHARMMLRGLLWPGRTLRNRAECGIWYDGKR